VSGSKKMNKMEMRGEEMRGNERRGCPTEKQALEIK
jgi:hypothetical protein